MFTSAPAAALEAVRVGSPARPHAAASRPLTMIHLIKQPMSR
jgi:hypothetical protein